MSLLMLREVNAHEESFKRYAHITGKSCLIRVAPNHNSMIHIEAVSNSTAINLYCDVDMLLKHCSSEVETLPVELIDENLLVGLARRYFSCNELLDPVSMQPLNNFTVNGIINNAKISWPLVCITSAQSFLWAELKNVTVPILPRESNEVKWSHLELLMQIGLGYTKIKHNDKTHLKCGDVLILDKPSFTMVVANTLRIAFRIEGENMVMESIGEQSSFSDENNISLIEENNLSLDNLELKVDFFLAEKTITLGDLQTLRINELIPLNDNNTHVNVSLRVGKHVIATGELVRIDDKLAVEIHSITGTE